MRSEKKLVTNMKGGIRFNRFACGKCRSIVEVPPGMGAPICCGKPMKKVVKRK